GFVRARRGSRRLTEAEILTWLDDHRRRTGQWPTKYAGEIPAAAGLTWRSVDSALYYGLRGLSGRSSIARLLRRSGRIHKVILPKTRSQSQIVKDATDRYRRFTGRWPAHADALIPMRLVVPGRRS